MSRRVVVTGIGVVSALGLDRDEFWNALRDGRSGIDAIGAVDCSPLRFSRGAEVRAWDADHHFDPRQAKQMDSFAQFGVVAAREAIADAGIEWSEELRERTAIVTGSCLGGRVAEHEALDDLSTGRRKRTSPLAIPLAMDNAAASQISMDTGVTGPTFTLSTACSSANHALGQAFHLLRGGTVDMALAGGSESPFTRGHLTMWDALRAVSSDTCRPFSRDRTGMVLGEGGAMLVLELLERALARGAAIYGEVVGFGMSADAHHLTQPLAAGAARAMRAALRDAEIHPEQIGYVNAHGTGTAANDAMETEAIRAVFGPHADRLAVSSTKSMHGHALGASAAFEAAATLLALRNGILPPTANFRVPDPACDLDVVPNTARAAEPEYALSNSFAFGGLNAVLAFRRWSS